MLLCYVPSQAPLSKRCALNMKKDLPALNSLMAKLGKVFSFK